MSAFEDFVQTEIPRRPTMLTQSITGFDGDPNSGSPPSIVANAPKGSFFLRETGFRLYKKNTSSSGSWQEVGAGAGGTTAPLTWFVETTGNDTTGDGSVGAPFATVGGALAKLRTLVGSTQRINHLVDIVVGTGNFPGFLVQGWEMDPADNTLPCGIRISGTFVNATLPSGTPTGTFTAVTAGQSTTDVVYSVVEDNTQNWPVNGLRGLMIEVLTGTSATSVLPIIANTATTITVPQNFAFGSVGGTYAIRDFGTVLNTTVPIAPSIPAKNAASQTPTPIHCTIGVFNTEVAPANTEIRIENFKLNATSAPSSANALSIQGEACTVARCFIGGNGTSPGARVNVNGGIGNIAVAQSVINAPTSSVTAISSTGTGSQNFSQNYIAAGSPVGSGTGGTGISIAGLAIINLLSTVIDPHLFGILISGQSLISCSGVTVTSGGSQCIRCRVIEGNSGGSFINASALKLLNAAASTGLEIQGPAFANITCLKVTGCADAVTATRGGRIRTASLSTDLSGNTREITLDDLTNSQTLAGLRALGSVPLKVFTSQYASAFWEDV